MTLITQAAGLAAAIALSMTALASAQDSTPAAPEMSVIPAGQERPGDHALGAEDAPLLMIEYASVVCPHCAHFHEDVYATLIKPDYIETGQVRFIVREMITEPAQLGYVGYMLAYCAPEENYFDALDLLFFEQRAIFEDAQSEGGALARYQQIAAAVGMSEEDFSACLNNQDAFNYVNRAHQQAIADGVRSTPSFFIAGQLLVAERGDGGPATYHWGGEPLIIDGEPVVAQINVETYRRIIEHFLAEAEN